MNAAEKNICHKNASEGVDYQSTSSDKIVQGSCIVGNKSLDHPTPLKSLIFIGHHPRYIGKRSLDYIVDPNNPDNWGTEATPHEFPWMVLIHDGCNHLRNWRLDWSMCGGSLVTPSLVMSAAHCLDCDPAGKSGIAYALLGVHQYNGRFTASFDNKMIEFFTGKPKYDVISIIKTLSPPTVKWSNDFAIYVLERPARLSPKICPLLLPNENSVVDKQAATVAGWGKKVHGGEKSLKLRKCDTITDTFNDRTNNCNNPEGKDRHCYLFLIDKTNKNECLACYGDSG